jgi:membrane fusion protein (multidrug efflux system)
VQGYLDDILVHENQQVREGEVMFRLDSGDYRIAIDSAKAKLETQKETLARIKAQIEAGSVSVQQAEASRRASTAVAHNADIAYHRAEELVTRKFASQAQLDNARATLDQANAALAGADAEVASAKANVKVLEAQYAEAASQTASLKLALEQAERNFTFTELKAPFDGVVGNIADHQGDLVSPGQKLASVVPLGELYIEANFKETQLAGIEPGETARISVDALPDQEVVGRVTSIAPASGSVFSLLPPENATGNFTKVVQRVPVRIDLPEDILATGKLRAGMSVVVDIDRRTAPSTN